MEIDRIADVRHAPSHDGEERRLLDASRVTRAKRGVHARASVRA